jgi:TP901 family phage tail tape measure protein
MKKAEVDVYVNNEQAKVQIEEIKNELRQLIVLRDKAGKEGNVKGYIKLNNEAKRLTKEITSFEKKVIDVDKILKNLSGSSIREIEQALSKANTELKQMKRNDAGFADKQKQVKLLRAELDTTNGAMRAQQSGLARLADGFNKYFALAASLVATFTGVIFSVKKAIEEFNNFEERLDNLSALTGLAGEALDWLSNKAKELSTSTLEAGIRVKQSAVEIIDAFTKTGSARPELLANKEALSAVTEEAIILANASKTELQPAIEALTMVMNQYNAPASEARRIINAIAAGSKAGAGEIPYITQAFEKAGTVAADAGISIETLVATIETLAPRITQPEIAGRSLKGVLIDLQTTSDETNPAIVGLATAFENLGKKQLSITELTKLFGTENITTAKILINNVDELRKYEAAVTGTNVAIEQAAINTDNNNAKLAQAKNRLNLITIELGGKLAPAFTFSTNAASYLIKSLAVMVDFLTKYWRIIVIGTAAIVTYTLAVNASGIALKIHYGWLLLVEKAQKLLNVTMKSNPIALVASAVAGLVTWLILYTNRTNEAAESQKKFNKFLENTDELMKSTKSIDERAATIDKMSKKQLDKFIEDTQTELAVYDELEQKKLIAAKEYEDAVKLVDARITRDAKTEDEKRAMYNNKYVTAERDVAFQRLTEISQTIDQNKAKLTDYIKQANTAAKKTADKDGVPTGPAITDSYEEWEKKSNELANKKREFTEKSRESVSKENDKYWDNYLDKRHTKDITALINNNTREVIALNEKYAKGELSEEEYAAEILRIKNKFASDSLILAINKAERELAILKLSGEDIVDAEKQLAELRLKAQESNGPDKPIKKKAGDIDAKDIANAGIESAQNTADAIAAIKANSRQAELDAELNALDQLREKELSNKNLTEDEKDAINEKYRKKEASIKLAAWKKDQQAAVVQAMINGALAVTKTFAAYGFTPAGWLAAAGQAVATGLQIAVIKAQKPPQFRAGGYTNDDFNDDKAVGTVHANEFVANAQAKRNPTVRPVLDIIDYAQRSGTIRSINLPAVIASNYIGMKNGGYASSEKPAGISTDHFVDNNKMMEVVKDLALVVDKLQRDGVQGKWVYQDFKTMADKETRAINKTN